MTERLAHRAATAAYAIAVACVLAGRPCAAREVAPLDEDDAKAFSTLLDKGAYPEADRAMRKLG